MSKDAENGIGAKKNANAAHAAELATKKAIATLTIFDSVLIPFLQKPKPQALMIPSLAINEAV